MVEGQHRVGLAAAKVVLQRYDRIAALAGEAPNGTGKKPLQAFGQGRAAEELDRLPVLVRALTQMHLPQAGGKLSPLVTAGGHVLVRLHHLAPGYESARDLTLDGRARALALLAAHLLVE